MPAQACCFVRASFVSPPPMPAGLGRSAGWMTSDDRGDGLVNI